MTISINHDETPTTGRNAFGEDEAISLAAALVRRAMPFIVEPQGAGLFTFRVHDAAGDAIDELILGFQKLGGQRQPGRFTIQSGRPAWGQSAAIVVPRLDCSALVAASIDEGSGIVAFKSSHDPDKFVIYYEGNRHNAFNLRTFADRALTAYGRMAMSYPTIATSVMDASLFEVVGEIGSDGHYELDVSAPALQAWVAHDPQLMDQPQATVLRSRMR